MVAVGGEDFQLQQIFFHSRLESKFFVRHASPFHKSIQAKSILVVALMVKRSNEPLLLIHSPQLSKHDNKSKDRNHLKKCQTYFFFPSKPPSRIRIQNLDMLRKHSYNNSPTIRKDSTNPHGPWLPPVVPSTLNYNTLPRGLRENTKESSSSP